MDALKTKDEGMTAWDLSWRLGRAVYVIRPRLTELKSLGLVHARGLRWHEETQRNEAIFFSGPAADAQGQLQLFEGAA